MVEAGSRYKNLEKSLGKGAIFVLGCKTSETIWTRTLPKKGQIFEGVIKHLKSNEIGRLAGDAKFARLRETLIGDRMAFFRRTMHEYTSTTFPDLYLTEADSFMNWQ
ncbi:hypothetical protein LTS08_005632 [Lithohypha guttulata]|uniref:uncharacterized protein n=1 Tax=Lithohypha guttulata TaxID=1690604 RepID=UPI002DDFC9FC|nr:hypothetical protein LTR51_003198 [Lithohypha guttulata]KAK5099917.1 hypothetical protein LTS08_005632 [Lithohypha guttulata]